jgi:hypothetical protein
MVVVNGGESVAEVSRAEDDEQVTGEKLGGKDDPVRTGLRQLATGIQCWLTAFQYMAQPRRGLSQDTMLCEPVGLIANFPSVTFSVSCSSFFRSI